MPFCGTRSGVLFWDSLNPPLASNANTGQSAKCEGWFTLLRRGFTSLVAGQILLINNDIGKKYIDNDIGIDGHYYFHDLIL